MFVLALLFIGLPIAEVMLLMEVGGRIGGWSTVGLCVLTGLVGASLARSQGLLILQRMQIQLQRGILPARELVDGLLILVAGAVLLTPGFITDALGLLLLFPPTRMLAYPVVARWLAKRVEGGGPDGATFDAWAHRREAPAQKDDVDRDGDDEQVIYPPDRAPHTPPRRGRPRVITYDD